jgi:chitin disaccharide deacetylase
MEAGASVSLMARRLIVNADGFGFGSGATQGILDTLRDGGFISSISVNANFPEVERLSELVAEFPDISVGVHLNPMAGRPCLAPAQVPSLVDEEGYFVNSKFMRRLHRGKISLAELEAEFDAQIARVKEIAGSKLTHLDSQGNSHLSYFPLFLKLAKKWQLDRMRNNASLICLESANPRSTRFKAYAQKPHVWLTHGYRKLQMRRAKAAGMRMADKLITVGYAGTGNKSEYENWQRILTNLPDGTYEIYCHPAYPDDTLRRWSYYYDERKRELDILRRGELRQLAANLGIQLVPFQAI